MLLEFSFKSISMKSDPGALLKLSWSDRDWLQLDARQSGQVSMPQVCTVVAFAFSFPRGVETPDSKLEAGPGSHAKLSVYVGLVWVIVAVMLAPPTVCWWIRSRCTYIAVPFFDKVFDPSLVCRSCSCW